MQSYFPIVWALIPLLKFPYIHNELKIKTKDQNVSEVTFVSKVSKPTHTDWTRKWRTDDETKVGLKFLCQEFCSMILQRMTRMDTSKEGFRIWKDGFHQMTQLLCRRKWIPSWHWWCHRLLTHNYVYHHHCHLHDDIVRVPSEIITTMIIFMIYPRDVSLTTNRYFILSQLNEYNR